MTDATRKIVLFLLVGAGAFVLAFGIGRIAGDAKEPEDHGGHGDHAAPTEKQSYAVELLDDSPLADGRQEIRFSVVDADGEPVTAYEVKHEKELHLIVAERDDPRIYAHVHPTLSDGVWSVETELEAGEYRLYADTTPEGADAQVLMTDFEVAGARASRAPLPAPYDEVTLDGYRVELTRDGSRFAFAVTDTGKLHRPVELEPYLGAGGHLVGIREESLDYVHAHAEDAEGDTVGFHVEAKRTGTYVLHLDFKVDGTVRTATFVQQLEADGPGAGMGEHEGHDMGDMGDMGDNDDAETEGHDQH
jgi:hypothetical protein